MKRFFTILVFTILLGGSAFAYDFSAVCESGQTLYYNITSETAPYTVAVTHQFITYNGSIGPTGDLTIPETVEYNSITYSVTSIGDSAFYCGSGLTSVAIPNSVTSIGDCAFYGCSGLTGITIPNFVTSIGPGAFCNCNGLTIINFNATNCTTMGNRNRPVFQINPLVGWGNSGRTITLNIGENVTNIPAYAFGGCNVRTTVNFNATNCTTVGENTWGSAFATLNIGENVTNIPANAFSGCSGLTSVTIGESVTSIGNDAFRECSGLTSVTIPNSVTSIGGGAFRECSGLTGELTIPNSVTSIGVSAFLRCIGLTGITIPSSVTIIENAVFSGCSGLTSIVIPDLVTEIGEFAFSGCSGLTSVTIGNSVTSIGDYAFYYCSGLTSVTFPNSVTSIGEVAFSGCSGLTSVTFPNSVTSIGNDAFSGCSGLTSITSYAIAPPQVGFNAFVGVSTDIPVYVPCATKQAYQNAEGWNNFTNIQIIEGETFQYTAVVSVAEESLGLGEVTVMHQSDCDDITFSVEATPNEHYHFVSWSDGSTDNPHTLTVVSDTIIKAFFAIDLHNITLSVNDDIMGTVSGEGTYEYNSEHEISATPNYGYHFVSWDDGNTDNPRTITVLQDSIFTAIFDNNEYTINVLSDSLEMGTVSGGNTYRYLDDVSIEAIANDGYIFVRWNDGNTENPRNIVVERDSTFTATFGILNEITIVDCNNYDLGGGYNFYETGTHYGFFTNAEGVDSVVRLNLTIEQPIETTLRVVATNNENRNVVTWNSVSNNTMLGYMVYRQNAYGEFEVVDSVAIDAECSWTDEQSNTAVRPYRYAVATYDSCGNISAMSASHRTIHLQISLAQGNARNLFWTDYEGLNFSTYRVYRGTEIGNMEMVMEMSAENHTYTDFDVQHDYFYQIEIVQGMKSNVISRSNIVSSNPNAIEDITATEITLFPNPATDILNITSSETISSVEIVNALGQVVYRAEVNAENAVCDVEGLANGVYVVRIHSRSLSGAEGAVIQQKFIKE